MSEYKRLTKRVNNYCVKVYVGNVDSLGLSGTYDDELDTAIFPVINRLAELEDKIDNGTLIEFPRIVGVPHNWVVEHIDKCVVQQEFFASKEAAEKRFEELKRKQSYERKQV